MSAHDVSSLRSDSEGACYPYGRSGEIEVTDQAERAVLREIVDQFTHDYPIDAEIELIDTETQRLKLCARILRADAGAGRLAVDDALLAALRMMVLDLVEAVADHEDDEEAAEGYRSELAACRRLVDRAEGVGVSVDGSISLATTLEVQTDHEREAMIELVSYGCSRLTDGGAGDLANLERLDLAQATALVEDAASKFSAFGRFLRLASANEGSIDLQMVDLLRAHRQMYREFLQDDIRGLERLRSTRNADYCPDGMTVDDGIRYEEERVEELRQRLAAADGLVDRVAPAVAA